MFCQRRKTADQAFVAKDLIQLRTGRNPSKNSSSGVVLIRSVPARQWVIVLQILKNAPKISIQQIREKVVEVIDRALVDLLHLPIRDSSQAIPRDLAIG